MENNKSKRVLQIVLIIVGVALIVFGVIQIAGGLKSSKVSNAFINKFNEINNKSGDIVNDLKTSGNLLLGLSEKENAKDYSGAVKDTETSIAKFDDAVAKINSLSVTITEFKTMIESNSDSAVKQSGLKLVDLLQQRDAAILKLINNSKQLIEPAKTYYEKLAAGETGTYLNNNQVASLTQKINDDNKILTALAPEINTANQNLANAAGFKLKEIK